MSKEQYTVIIIQAYEEMTPQMGLTDSCLIEIIDDNVESAIEKAKKLIKKKEYRVKSIVQAFK